MKRLQTGVVDGSENTPSNTYTQRHHEVQKYIADTNHGYIGYAVITNKKFGDGLPADIRTTLEGAMRDATKYASDIAKNESDDALEAIRKAGRSEVIALTPAQKAAWKKALVAVHKDNEGRVGTDTIGAVCKQTGFKP
jgi:C4-dicarboxylate-binding protein DctP